MGLGAWWRRMEGRYVENLRRRGAPAPISRSDLVLWWVGLVVLLAAKQIVSDRVPDRWWWQYAAAAPFWAYVFAGHARLNSPTPWRVRQWVRERVSGGRG